MFSGQLGKGENTAVKNATPSTKKGPVHVWTAKKIFATVAFPKDALDAGMHEGGRKKGPE